MGMKRQRQMSFCEASSLASGLRGFLSEAASISAKRPRTPGSSPLSSPTASPTAAPPRAFGLAGACPPG